jgi:hypothetical protein
MNDEQIKNTLAEVGAAWLMDPDDEHGPSAAIRHLVAAVQAAERERLKADAETWGSALNAAGWAAAKAYRRHTGQVEPAIFFNHAKGIVRDALAAYFSALRA